MQRFRKLINTRRRVRPSTFFFFTWAFRSSRSARESIDGKWYAAGSRSPGHRPKRAEKISFTIDLASCKIAGK